MPDIPELTPAEFMGRWRPGADDVVLLDVREDQELARASIEGALHIPMNEIPARLAELDRGKPIVAMCHSGARSLRVATFLNAQGFGQVFNLKGGIEAWLRDVETQSPRD